MSVWICKFDGTIQCQDNPEIPLDVMAKQLASLIGPKNILNREKRSRIVIQLCGMPTGRMNAYEVTEEGWAVLKAVGRCGFGLCPSTGEGLSKKEASEKEAGIGEMIRAHAATPKCCQELEGLLLRVYRTGDPITAEWLPYRFNIETDNSNTIAKVWFG